MRRLGAASAATLLFTAGLVGLTSTPASSATPIPKAVNGGAVTKFLRGAVNALPVRAEVRAGYDRDLFKHWNDVDRDCQSTRSEVLRQESKKRVTGRCSVATGKWVSQYDGAVRYRARVLDIDHLVPLAEAWDSGARSWSASRRQAFANDLTEARSLIAVTASTNRSKGDRDPSEWMPAKARCKYVLQWTVVKIRWGLSVDAAEKVRMQRTARACPNVRFTTHRAIVKMVGGTASGSGDGGGDTTGGGGAGIDPRFDTCTEAKSHGYGPYFQGSDPEYDWYDDRDDDGIVCE